MSTHYNSIQLGEDGRGPGGRRGMGLKPPAAGSSFLTVRGNKLHFATENV
jgi:hypothetical protein